jgi:hypothetical protein
MRLFGKGDLKICRLRHQGSTHYFIAASEMRTVMESVGEVAYCLYSYYRTGFFNDSDDIADETVGTAIGWNPRKIQKYRLILETSNLFRIVRFGTKTSGATQVFVGADIVALYDAGLPPDILDSKAFSKLKKAFKLNSQEDLIAHAPLIAKEYERNPDLYR